MRKKKKKRKTGGREGEEGRRVGAGKDEKMINK